MDVDAAPAFSVQYGIEHMANVEDDPGYPRRARIFWRVLFLLVSFFQCGPFLTP